MLTAIFEAVTPRASSSVMACAYASKGDAAKVKIVMKSGATKHLNQISAMKEAPFMASRIIEFIINFRFGSRLSNTSFDPI